MNRFLFLSDYTADLPAYLNYGVHSLIYVHLLLFFIYLIILTKDKLKAAPVKEELLIKSEVEMETKKEK
jgi:hypothetical protein